MNDLGNAFLSLLPVQAGSASVAAFGAKAKHGASVGLKFGDVLNTKVDSAVPQSALAQLTALVASGTPIATIAAQLATTIAQSVPGSDAESVRSLTRILTAALAPPGTAPPTGTAAEQVAALARRLTTIVTAVAREAENAGQQNDLSGKILDANSAKETPAQQKTAPLSSGIDTGALVQSLLSQVIATLQPGSTVPAATSGASAAAAAVSNIGSRPTLRAPQDPTAGQPTVSTDSNDGPVPQVTPNPPPAAGSAADLLGRIVARAVNVDAQLNGATPTSPVRPAGGTPTAAVLFARLIQTVAQSSQSSGGTSSQFSWDQLHRFDKSAASSKNASSTTAAIAVGTPASTDATNQPAADKTTTAPAAPVYDPEAVLAQVVRGLSIRTGDGAQEVRLNLQPEHLGEVSLKLTVDGTNVSATVVAQSSDVASTLTANQHQLARAFADAGLTLTSFNVDVSGGNTPQQQRDNTQGFGRRYVVHELGGEQAETDLDAVPTFGPPTAATEPGLLNQLA